MADEGGKNKGEEGYKLSEDPAFQEMQKAVKGLGLLVQQQQQAGAKMNENFTTLMAKLDGAITGGPRGDSLDDDDDDLDINDLDNKQLVKVVVGEISKMLDKKVEPITKRVEDVNNDLTSSKVKRQIDELGAKDFFDWRDEIEQLAKENPTLNVKRLYTLARAEDPDKAADLDEKYRDKSKDSLKFMGLMPTNSGRDVESGDEKLTNDEAKERAWEETLEEFPALANLGEG